MNPRRIALVTGASAGIGLAIAHRLHADGYGVVGLGRREALLRERLPAGADALACDVADAGAVRAALSTLLDRHGRLDALVNCAGQVQRGAIGELTDEDVSRQIAVNLLGTVHVVRAAAAALRRSRGAIVNFSSTLSAHPVPGVSIYAATKGAIEAFTRAMSIELADDGVRVNAVAPALVRSDIWTAAGMSEAAYQALMEARARDYPLGRVGEPSDVAGVVAFLLSDACAWITGVCVPVDGGSSVNVLRR